MENIGSIHISRIVEFAVTPPKYTHDPLEWVTFSGVAECFVLSWKPLAGHNVHVASKHFDWGSCVTDSQGRFAVSDRLPGFNGTYLFQAIFEGTWNIRPCASSTISIVIEGIPPPNGEPNGEPPPPLPPSTNWRDILLYGGIGLAAIGIIWTLTRRAK